MLDEKLKALEEASLAAIAGAQSGEDLYQVKVTYWGKQGELSNIMKDMSNMPKEDRPEFGKKVNLIKLNLEKAYEEKEQVLKQQELNSRLQSEKIDMSLPGPNYDLGAKHPISMVTEDIVAIFSNLGFAARSGPLIESDYYNFEALNIPKDHPARDMQDTFYIDKEHVLRTQTSPIQIHSLESESLPLRVLGPGAVFRVDADITHAPMFHQMEGMYVDHKVSMAELKGALSYFNKEFFGSKVKTRFRPSFFPFTEPSAEVDCSCPECGGSGCRLCSYSGWIEVAGCGLVHPNVFTQAGIDASQWQGYAFGMGVERLAMVKYGIKDIRWFVENDERFLEQFI